MKGKVLVGLVQTGAMAAALSLAAVAQNPHELTLSGTISDYTPPAVGAIWEMHGIWSLKVHPDSGTADFQAALNMEHSDAGSANGTLTRNPHTHHITLKDAQFISDPSYVAANCPTTNSPYNPKTTTGFAVVGLASTTGNGANAPFAAQGQQSQLTVCVTGSDQVEFSNITLVFPATKDVAGTDVPNPAAGHFGTQPINGVVRSARQRDEHGHS